MVSNDRHFLNTVCTNIVDVDYGGIKMYVGNYEFWYESSQMMQRLIRDQNKKKEEKIKELQEFVSRFSANKSKSKQATARRKLLDKLTVDYYGVPTPIQQAANVSVPEARMIQIQPWEKSMLKAIEKAILTSDIGINPTNDGSSIRLVFPELTEERRKELAKDVKKKGEGAKVAVRNIRRDGNVAFKKLKGTEVSEDEIKDLEDELQKLTDKYVEKIDKMVETKSKEIMTV